jgi:hypothetical protein
VATEFGHIFKGLFKHPDGSWAWWKIAIFLGVATVIVVAAIRSRGEPRIKGALTGTARVLSLQPTNAGNEFAHTCKIGLRVEIPGRAPYDVTIRQNVRVIHLARVQPGAAIPVQVDPANPQKVLIDFNEPITPPQA